MFNIREWKFGTAVYENEFSDSTVMFAYSSQIGEVLEQKHYIIVMYRIYTKDLLRLSHPWLKEVYQDVWHVPWERLEL